MNRAPTIDFPDDIYSFWEDEWFSGPELEGVENYFIRTFQFGEPGATREWQSTPWPHKRTYPSEDSDPIVLWWDEAFPKGFRYRAYDGDSQWRAMSTQSLVLVDEENGKETL